MSGFRDAKWVDGLFGGRWGGRGEEEAVIVVGRLNGGIGGRGVGG